MVRTQVILREQQRRAIDQLAKEHACSISAVVREMIDSQLRAMRGEQLRKAAERLRSDYLHDSELTAFSAIDGETFDEQG